MTLHSEKRHRTALNKIKKLNVELQERKEYAADEIKRLTAQCDSLSTAVHVHEQELAETRTELVSLDSQLALVSRQRTELCTESIALHNQIDELKHAFISNVVRLEEDNKRLEQNVEHLKSLAGTAHEVRMGITKLTTQNFEELQARTKELESVNQRHHEAYVSLESKHREWARRAATAEARVEELEKTLALLPGCDNPRSPQDVMDVTARLGRLEEMEESSMYEAGRNSVLQERNALNGSVQAYSKRVARLDEELAKLGKEYCALREEHIKTVDDLYRAKNYAAGPSWEEHREALASLVGWKARVQTLLLGNGRIANPGLLYWLESQDEDFKQDVRRNFIQPGLKALRAALLPRLLETFKDAPSVVVTSTSPSKGVKP
jgi:chromosome segregation ATPase